MEIFILNHNIRINFLSLKYYLRTSTDITIMITIFKILLFYFFKKKKILLP